MSSAPSAFVGSALRYFNASGADPDGRIGEDHEPEEHLIPRAIAAAAGGPALTLFGDDYPTPDGTCIRDFVHVADLADAHIAALRALEAGGAVVSLQSGQRSGLVGSRSSRQRSARDGQGRAAPDRTAPPGRSGAARRVQRTRAPRSWGGRRDSRPWMTSCEPRGAGTSGIREATTWTRNGEADKRSHQSLALRRHAGVQRAGDDRGNHPARPRGADPD